MAWTSHPSNKMFDCLLNGRKPTRLDWKARKQSRIFLSQVGHWRHCKLGVTLAIAALCVVSCVAIDRSGPADENAAVVTLITKLASLTLRTCGIRDRAETRTSFLWPTQ